MVSLATTVAGYLPKTPVSMLNDPAGGTGLLDGGGKSLRQCGYNYVVICCNDVRMLRCRFYGCVGKLSLTLACCFVVGFVFQSALVSSMCCP